MTSVMGFLAEELKNGKFAKPWRAAPRALALSPRYFNVEAVRRGAMAGVAQTAEAAELARSSVLSVITIYNRSAT
jgi:hypothetical protein